MKFFCCYKKYVFLFDIFVYFMLSLYMICGLCFIFFILEYEIDLFCCLCSKLLVCVENVVCFELFDIFFSKGGIREVLSFGCLFLSFCGFFFV